MVHKPAWSSAPALSKQHQLTSAATSGVLGAVPCLPRKEIRPAWLHSQSHIWTAWAWCDMHQAHALALPRGLVGVCRVHHLYLRAAFRHKTGALQHYTSHLLAGSSRMQ